MSLLFLKIVFLLLLCNYWLITTDVQKQFLHGTERWLVLHQSLDFSNGTISKTCRLEYGYNHWEASGLYCDKGTTTICYGTKRRQWWHWNKLRWKTVGQIATLWHKVLNLYPSVGRPEQTNKNRLNSSVRYRRTLVCQGPRSSYVR